MDSGERCASAGHNAIALAAISNAGGRLLRQRIFRNQLFDVLWGLG